MSVTTPWAELLREVHPVVRRGNMELSVRQDGEGGLVISLMQRRGDLYVWAQKVAPAIYVRANPCATLDAALVEVVALLPRPTVSDALVAGERRRCRG